VVLTVFSTLVAVVMSVVAWRLVRESRERSAARVAALSDAIDGVPSHAFDDPDGLDAFPVTPSSNDTAALPGGMFGKLQESRSPLLRIGPALLAGVVLVGGVVGLALIVSSGGEKASAAASAAPRPLELLSLRHELTPAALTVTGLVRNASENAPHERIAAMVFLFDANGAFLGSGRAPLDFTTLSPGEESPFVVSVKRTGNVARYRVSFRRDEGGVVPHVDRRERRQP
jgi:hypothetical protein